MPSREARSRIGGATVVVPALAAALALSGCAAGGSGWGLPDRWPETLASAAVSFAVPLLLAGIGECVVERAGVINIGLEGLMLAAALAAVAASHVSGSPWLGLLAGIGAAAALGLLFGVLAVYTPANQVVLGTAVNLLALGLTGAAYFTLTQRLAREGVTRVLGVKLPD